MNQSQLRKLIVRLCELHAREEGLYMVWHCGDHLFMKLKFSDDDGWTLDSAFLTNMSWHELMAVGAILADCVWDR